MTATQEILFGVASQSFELVADRPLASITSVSVWPVGSADTATAESATTGSAAVDSATEATTAAAGRDQTDKTKLTMASTAGFVAGRRGYIAVNGISETFEIARVHTNTAIYTRHPLVNAYASGATVDMTTRATISVLDSWAADVGNLSPTADPNPSYRVRWVVVHADDSTTAVYDRYFDLVRYPSSPPVGPLDVDRARPGWIDSLPADYKASQGRPLIVEATRAVRLDLYHRGIADQALRNGEVYEALVIDRAVWASVEARAIRGGDVGQGLEVAKDRYDRRLAGLVDSPRLSLDLTGGGGTTTKTGRSEPLWVRSP